MQRRPRSPDAPLFSRSVLRRSILLGTIALVFSIGVYGLALTMTSDEAARALAFFGIVVGNLALIFVSRSQTESLATIFARPNAVFWWITALALIAVAVAIFVPSVASVFQFAAPTWTAMTAVLVSGSLLLLVSGSLFRPEE